MTFIFTFMTYFVMYLIGGWVGWNLRKKHEKKCVDTGNKVDQRGCIAGGDIVGGNKYL